MEAVTPSGQRRNDINLLAREDRRRGEPPGRPWGEEWTNENIYYDSSLQLFRKWLCHPMPAIRGRQIKVCVQGGCEHDNEPWPLSSGKG